jgi:glycosyltransferase involved in cell wall biosynthesis
MVVRQLSIYHNDNNKGIVNQIYGIVKTEMLFILFALALLLELGLYALPSLWNYRRKIAVILIMLCGFSSGSLLTFEFNLIGGLCFLIGTFRVINYLRIIENRMHPNYLRRVVRRSGLLLMALQTASIGLMILLVTVIWPAQRWWLAATALQLVGAVIILFVTTYNIYKTRHLPLLEHYSDKELPTITIAIPARNETEDLQECLRTILSNDYPKLEVIVLDDCSQDKTSEIIRSFAQDGVRFVPGHEPAERWLAKNQAYDKLADEANGAYILFCGVDVRFGPDAIRALVSTVLNRKKEMISVMPLRTTGSIMNAFVAPPRYWWELALPRILVNRPPVLSTCWLISRKKLKKLGGFGAVSHAIIPEGYFARELIKTNEYSFIRADEVLDIQTRKKPREQRDTAIRTLYPQIRRRPEIALLLTIIDIGLLFAPFVLFIVGFWVELGLAQWLAGMAALVLTLTHILIVRVSDPTNTIVALVNLPVAVLIELWLGLISMWKYEFSTVEWKGRNICIPVMHVIPRLPKA